VLRGVSPTLCAPYLEAALAAHVASRETYETELAVMYLQALLEGGPGPAGARTELHALGSTDCCQLVRDTWHRQSIVGHEACAIFVMAGLNGDAKPPARSPFANSEKFPAKLDKGEAFKKLKTLVSTQTRLGMRELDYLHQDSACCAPPPEYVLHIAHRHGTSKNIELSAGVR